MFILYIVLSQHEVTEISVFRSRTTHSVLKFLSQHHSCVVTKLWELFSYLKQVHSCSVLSRCVTVGLYLRAEVCVRCMGTASNNSSSPQVFQTFSNCCTRKHTG